MKLARPLFVLLIALLVFGTSQAVANVFASNVRITQQGALTAFDGSFTDGTGVSIRFILSDHADSVVVSIKLGSTNVRTLRGVNLMMGDTAIVWDGKNSSGSFVGNGTYTIGITCYDMGYLSYTEIFYAETPGLSTRGMTTVNNPALKAFGFSYGIDNAGFQSATGAVRFAADGEPWGNAKGTGAFTTTGLPLGPSEARYSPQADDDGYVHVFGRTAKQMYRFHPDSGVVTLVDSGYGAYYPYGMAFRKDGSTKTVAVVANVNSGTATVTGDSKVFTYKVAAGATTYFGAKDTLLKGGGAVMFWDVTFGRDSSLYATFMYSTDWPRSGVAKFDLRGKKLPLTLADTAWTVRADSGRCSTVAYSYGSATNGSKDVVYFVISRIGTGNPPSGQGIYAITGVTTATPVRAVAYADRQSNASLTRTDISVDPAGNIVYYENSNEEVAIISPPSGSNSYTTTVSVSLVVSDVERTEQVPSNFMLEQNYPNPFNPSTTIRFSLSSTSSVTLKVFDVLGREVAEVVNQELREGVYSYRFDASRLAAGTYLYRLTARTNKDGREQVFTDVKKLVVLK